MRKTLVAATALLALTLSFGAAPLRVEAQNASFAPRLMVDGRVITHYEYDQRLRFMTLLNAPGDLRKQAEETLIDDRLRLLAADALKIKLTEKQITDGMTEFAGRFEMPVEQFLQIINANGVATETFRDFVHAGMIWRDVVRAKYGPSAPASIYEPQIDNAMSDLMTRNTTRVLLSELILPSDERNKAEELATSIKGAGAFAAAARSHSIAESAAQGGEMAWQNLATLPQRQLQAILQAGAGGVTRAVPTTDGRLAIYLVRQIEEREGLSAATTGVDYARLVLPAGQADSLLAKIRADVQTCNELNAYPGQLSRQTVVQSALNAEVAGRLAALDRNEFTHYAVGGQQVVLMLCQRGVQSAGEPDRDVIRGRLVDAQAGGQADIYLKQLRANAHIRRP